MKVIVEIIIIENWFLQLQHMLYRGAEDATDLYESSCS